MSFPLHRHGLTGHVDVKNVAVLVLTIYISVLVFMYCAPVATQCFIETFSYLPVLSTLTKLKILLKFITVFQEVFKELKSAIPSDASTVHSTTPPITSQVFHSNNVYLHSNHKSAANSNKLSLRQSE